MPARRQKGMWPNPSSDRLMDPQRSHSWRGRRRGECTRGRQDCRSQKTCGNSNEVATEKVGGEHYGFIRYGEERGLVT